MELLGNMVLVESSFSPFGDSANLDTRLVHVLCRTYHKLQNCFGPTNSKVTKLKWKLISFYLEIVLILAKHRCTDCSNIP
jgi:hypothetical protein